VNANKNGIGKFICQRGAVFERNETVGASGQPNIVARLCEKTLGPLDDIQGRFFLNAERPFGTAIMPAMPRILNHRGDASGIFNQTRPHDGLYDFCYVHGRNENFSILGDNRKTEDVFDIIDVNFTCSGFAFYGF
jgi:hypothetical protein